MAAQKNGVGDRTNDPGRNSLRLLPSGPDRVGEGPVRRQPPTPLYQVRRVPGQAPLAKDPKFARRCAPFETAASQPPQDEESLGMPSIQYLILRSARRARLEGRRTLMHAM